LTRYHGGGDPSVFYVSFFFQFIIWYLLSENIKGIFKK